MTNFLADYGCMFCTGKNFRFASRNVSSRLFALRSVAARGRNIAASLTIEPTLRESEKIGLAILLAYLSWREDYKERPVECGGSISPGITDVCGAKRLRHRDPLNVYPTCYRRRWIFYGSHHAPDPLTHPLMCPRHLHLFIDSKKES
ncbi:hypothetical protein J6590_035380 [Homalodisca vitripennis]|nr:hypothetical protein J6590_035380 [Homalodisca vitripennis]